MVIDSGPNNYQAGFWKDYGVILQVIADTEIIVHFDKCQITYFAFCSCAE